MKNFSISLFSLCLLFLSSVSFAGVLDIRFASPELTQNEDGTSTYCVDVEVKAQDISLEIGSATVFFEYNTAALQAPTFTALNFNGNNTCAENGLAPYSNSFNFLEMNGKGEGNYAILLSVPNQGCPTVTKDDWVSVAQYCFEVVDASQAANLTINTKYTGFNTDENNGNQHNVGEIENLNTTAVGIENLTVNQVGVTVFPNITNDLVNVAYVAKGQTDLSVTVYDLQGKVLQTQTATMVQGAEHLQLNLNQYGNGYYLVEVTDGQHTMSEKVLLMK